MNSRAIFIIAAIVAVTGSADTPNDKMLFKSDFESANVGSLPEELMVLAGEFSVSDTAATRHSSSSATRRKTRAHSTGGIGWYRYVRARFFRKLQGLHSLWGWLDGVAGYRLRRARSKSTATLKDQEAVASAPLEWVGTLDMAASFRFARCRRGNGSRRRAGRMDLLSQTSGRYPLN
jgi:hypothetical protein